MGKEIRVIRKQDTRDFLEGDERCKGYLEGEGMVFGTSRLPPGKRGDVDPGHADAYEIFYVAKGRVICHFGESNVSKELEEEDAVLIPPGEPHQLINVSDGESLVVWSQYPIQE